MRLFFTRLCVIALTAFCSTPAALAAPNVVATIKPLHALVAAVMDGVGVPTLLVKGAASPHTYSLRPSDATALEQADIVFWTGHGMELFLEGALGTLTRSAQVVEMAPLSGLTLYPTREGGAFESHSHGYDDDSDHDHDHLHEAEHPATDLHFWLDPLNAKVMVSAIAATLSAADPDNAETYTANAEAENAHLDALTADLQSKLEPIQGKPFVVFHDAYQYFEARFGLTVAGSITVTPDVMPGVQRIEVLKTRVTELGSTCVFAEPQFEPRIIAAITEGTKAGTGVLDPEGGALEQGKDLYPTLLRGLARALLECLDTAQ